MTTIATHYQHIDNGGITVSIEDRGAKEGIYLSIDGQYFGYPGIRSDLRIDPPLGDEWLKNVGLMLIEAAGKMKTINWEARYQ